MKEFYHSGGINTRIFTRTIKGEGGVRAMTIPTMKTIREASNATGISYDRIRKMCLQNKIVYCKSGKKYYINMEKFVEYLNKGDGQDEADNPTP
jgi:excisionase family DNA binding protein